MAGFSTVNAVNTAWAITGRGQRLQFSKASAHSSIALIPASLWDATGSPTAGAYGSVGKANGRVLVDTTAGGIPYNNAKAGTTNHLIGAEIAMDSGGGGGTVGTMMIVDRISDCLLAHAEASGSITGLTAVSRLGATEGAQIWCEVQTGFSAASNTITFTYTNQDGTGSRTTGDIVTTSSAAATGRSVNSNLWQPLQAGDSGVRSIESVTLASGTATGQYAVCLVRPLATVPMAAISAMCSRNFVVQMPSPSIVYDDSCLSLIYFPNGSQAPTVWGEIKICSN